MGWTIKAITSHYSYKSCENIGNIFQSMFLNSLISKHLHVLKRKTSYLATFSIVTYVLTLLKENTKKQNGHV